MSGGQDILALEDRRLAAMIAVRILGDVALVNGKAHIEAEIGGQPRTMKLLFLNAWTRTPQGWKFVAWQSCPQPS